MGTSRDTMLQCCFFLHTVRRSQLLFLTAQTAPKRVAVKCGLASAGRPDSPRATPMRAGVQGELALAYGHSCRGAGGADAGFGRVAALRDLDRGSPPSSFRYR